ncbi:MAG: helix-turn-helix domain-containing protein [Bifidobacteriaceae bacterium]|nr:helix-turn-helix domain-containing protein [Bifidobacteriaceae bacterium]
METTEATAAAGDTSDPKAGLRAIVSLRALADTLELRQVNAAVRAGLTWQEIADALGVTRQAAHKRFSKRIDPELQGRRLSKRRRRAPEA